jgi:hypothetical protein
MCNGLLARSLVTLFLITVPLSASADQTPSPGTVRCTGSFGREASRSDLVRTFGAANVVDQEIEGHGGEAWLGTVVYPDDPERRLEILWGDEKNQRLPGAIWITKESEWRGWRDVHIGMPLETVESLNGNPFKLRDFHTDYAGTVTDWRGGAMERIPGGCRVLLRFEPDDSGPPGDYEGLVGELLSSNPKVHALRLTVSEIYTIYPK